MHKADTQGRTGSSPMARSGPSPFVAFAVAAVLALAGLGVWFLAAQGEAPKPAPAPEIEGAPAVVLTEAEAKAEFERLNALRIEAYETRDLGLLSDFLASNSSLLPLAKKEISQLERDQIDVHVIYRPLSTRMISSDISRIVLEQRAVQALLFSKDGKDVTSDQGKSIRVTRWTLVKEGSLWKLFDSNLISEKNS